MRCQTFVAQLGHMVSDFQKAGAEMLVVLGNTPEHAANPVQWRQESRELLAFVEE